MKNINYHIALLLLMILSACTEKQQVDLIIHNAIIYQVDSLFSSAEAMAIKEGRIVAVGNEQSILDNYESSERINAERKPIYPGFIDAHCHFLSYGFTLQHVDLMNTRSFEEVINRVVAFSEKNPTGWITGRGWDQNDWAIKEFPNNTILDSLFPDRPVLIKRVDGHAALANSEALKRANITVGKKIEGGIFITKDNQLTGLLIDNAVDSVAAVIPANSLETIQRALLEAQIKCFAVGLTSLADAGMKKREIEVIDQLHRSGELKMKIYAMLADNEENLAHYLVSGPYKTDKLNVCSFKFYADGALGSRGAALTQPYADDENNYGIFLHPHEYLAEHAQKMYNAGFQMNTHCIGDSANRVMLDIYAAVLKSGNDKRWRIEHAQVVSPKDIHKYGTYNILPSVQPTHATSDMYWASDRLGEARVTTAYAWADLLQQNDMIPLGSDFPVEHINPIYTFYAAVWRKDHKGFPERGYQMENKLSREQALRGMTIWAAYANFEDQAKGSLEPGKAADFIILDKDIMKISEEQILETKVLKTFIDGENVFTKF